MEFCITIHILSFIYQHSQKYKVIIIYTPISLREHASADRRVECLKQIEIQKTILKQITKTQNLKPKVKQVKQIKQKEYDPDPAQLGPARTGVIVKQKT